MTDQVPTLADLYQAKRDVKDINTFTHSPETTFVDGDGLTKLTLAGIVAAGGYYPVAGSFETGGTINERNQVLLRSTSPAAFFSWGGVLPKVVTVGSTVAGTGGESVNAWTNRNDGAFETALGAVDSEKLVGGVEAGKITVPVAHLKALPTVGMVNGRQYQVTGFYSGSVVGAGLFVWDTTKNKNEHNGVTVISPESLAAWDGTHLDINSLIDWSGSGAGCFIRSFYDILSLDSIGCLTTGYLNQFIVNAAIEHVNLDGNNKQYGISGKVTIQNNKLSNVIFVCSLTWDGQCDTVAIKNSGSYYNLTINGQNSLKTSLSGYTMTNGVICLNTDNCNGEKLKIVDLGNKEGTTVDGSYALQIQRDLSATQDCFDNHFSGVEIVDQNFRLAFHGRIVTNFDFYVKGQQGYECYNNSISNVNSTGCGFNNFEICGPDTHDNIISDVSVHDTNGSDVFDFDHGAYNNSYARCSVKKVTHNTRSGINLFSSKESRVSTGRALNRTTHNTFNSVCADNIKVTTGKTVRVLSTAYPEDVSFKDPKVINTVQSDIVGSLVFYETLIFANVPNVMDSVIIDNPVVDYCSTFLNLVGTSGNYIYNSLSIKGGKVTCSRAVNTSTSTAIFNNPSIDGLELTIKGTSDNDALRFPICNEGSVTNSLLKGDTTNARVYNLGATSGTANRFMNNTVVTAVGHSSNPGSVSSSNSLHENNVYVNCTSLGQTEPAVANTIYIESLAALLGTVNEGFTIFNSEKKLLNFWDGSQFNVLPTTRSGNTGTLTFYASVLGSADGGFQVFNADNDTLNIWNGTAFKRFNSV